MTDIGKALVHQNMIHAISSSSFKTTVSVLLAGLILAGCRVGPNYREPEMRLPDHFSEPATTQPSTLPTTQPVIGLARWWEAFDDPTLSSLIERAANNNLD